MTAREKQVCRLFHANDLPGIARTGPVGGTQAQGMMRTSGYRILPSVACGSR
jgi:hypothetical protein